MRHALLALALLPVWSASPARAITGDQSFDGDLYVLKQLLIQSAWAGGVVGKQFIINVSSNDPTQSFLVVLPNGNVGIRTKNPARPLDIIGDFGATGALYGAALYVNNQLVLATGAVLTSSLTVVNGDVSIGASRTSEPVGVFISSVPVVIDGTGSYLSVASSITANAFVGNGSALTNVAVSNPGVSALAGFTADRSGGSGVVTSTLPTTITSTLTVQGNAFSVGTSTFAVTAGSVAIGTSNPAYSFQNLVGGSHVLGQSITGGTMTVQGNAFSVGASTFAVIGSSVGIGTSNPNAALHISSGTLIVGNAATDPAASFMINNGGYLYVGNYSAGANFKGIGDVGNMGAGGSGYSFGMQSGNTYLNAPTGSLAFSAAGNTQGCLSSGGNFYFTGNCPTTQTGYRLKTDTVGIADDGVLVVRGTMTVYGDFGIGNSSFVVKGSSVGIHTSSPNTSLEISSGGIIATGASGYIASMGSVTAAGFFGNGAALTNLPTSVSNPGVAALVGWTADTSGGQPVITSTIAWTATATSSATFKAAVRFEGTETFTNGTSDIVDNGAGGTVGLGIAKGSMTVGGSVNSSYGLYVNQTNQRIDGTNSYLTVMSSVNAASIWVSSGPIYNDGTKGYILSKGSITANAFFGDGSNLTNVGVSNPGVAALGGFTADTSGGQGLATSTIPVTFAGPGSTVTFKAAVRLEGTQTFTNGTSDIVDNGAGGTVGLGIAKGSMTVGGSVNSSYGLYVNQTNERIDGANSYLTVLSSVNALSLWVSSGNAVFNGLGQGGVTLSTITFVNYVASQTVPYLGVNISTLTRIASVAQNVTTPVCVGSAPITVIGLGPGATNYIEASGITAFTGADADTVRTAWLLDGKCNEPAGLGSNPCAEMQLVLKGVGYNGLVDRMVFTNVSAGLHWVCFAFWNANDTMAPLNFTVIQLQ